MDAAELATATCGGIGAAILVTSFRPSRILPATTLGIVDFSEAAEHDVEIQPYLRALLGALLLFLLGAGINALFIVD
jgi:hypothetical protein